MRTGKGNRSSQEAREELLTGRQRWVQSAPGKGQCPSTGRPATARRRFMPLMQRRMLRALAAWSSNIKFLELSQVVVIPCSINNSLILMWLPIKCAHKEMGWPEELNIYSISSFIPHCKWTKWHSGFLHQSHVNLISVQAFLSLRNTGRMIKSWFCSPEPRLQLGWLPKVRSAREDLFWVVQVTSIATPAILICAMPAFPLHSGLYPRI